MMKSKKFNLFLEQFWVGFNNSFIQKLTVWENTYLFNIQYFFRYELKVKGSLYAFLADYVIIIGNWGWKELRYTLYLHSELFQVHISEERLITIIGEPIFFVLLDGLVLDFLPAAHLIDSGLYIHKLK